jgi:hypothetical protein
MSTIAQRVTTSVCYYSFAHSLAARARAILPIYAKTMVALARAACHLTQMKIYECCWLRIGSFGVGSKNGFPQATRTIPIVFPVAGDPAAASFVESLARPGGNITGFRH